MTHENTSVSFLIRLGVYNTAALWNSVHLKVKRLKLLGNNSLKK
jgi:hypothetical protein